PTVFTPGASKSCGSSRSALKKFLLHASSCRTSAGVRGRVKTFFIRAVYRKNYGKSTKDGSRYAPPPAPIFILSRFELSVVVTEAVTVSFGAMAVEDTTELDTPLTLWGFCTVPAVARTR